MISGARRPRARCAVSDRRLAGAAAVALRRYFKKATASDRWREWAAQSICEWARRSVREWAKLPSPARRKKRQRRSPCDASRQIYFTAWVVCAREMMTSTFLVAIDQGGE